LRARATWRIGTLRSVHDETDSARTLVLNVPDWPGHDAGQHVDVRLTAPDGYRTQRSYSLAAPADGGRVELTVQHVDDGEVSEYLTKTYSVGDPVEIRGPVGGWFVWRPAQTEPILLAAGGSGIVPLMAMIRARSQAKSRAPFRLIYSARSPREVIFGDELRTRARDDRGLDVSYVYTREPTRKRITLADVNTHGWPADLAPTCFVCGPTGFVETVADMLVALGHDPRRVKTERFG
jgi:ferredoxin-NADP reductase